MARPITNWKEERKVPEKKVLVSDFECDRHPGEELDVEQVHFDEVVVDGTTYKLVLCKEAKDELDEALRAHDQTIADAEKVLAQAKTDANRTLAVLLREFAEGADEVEVVGSSKRRRRRDNPDEPASVDVREWAKAAGIKVKDRGRVPKDIVLRYKEATGWRPTRRRTTTSR